MKVNLCVALKNLAGKDVENQNGEIIILSKFVAEIIASDEADKGNILQKSELADKLYNATGEIEIAESEKEIIKKVCEGGRMRVLSAAQTLKIINNAK